MIPDEIYKRLNGKFDQVLVTSQAPDIAFSWKVESRRRLGEVTGSVANGVIETADTKATLTVSGAIACVIIEPLPNGVPNPTAVLRIKLDMLERARKLCTPT